MKKILLLLMGTSLLYSCRYDNEEELLGLADCDTANIRYSVQINSILQSRCFECHGGNASNGGGLRLSDYNVLRQVAQSGLLLDAVTRQINRMPKGRQPLTACQISQIRTWVRNGALNN
jgi:mono/diheme cytochrome c family protein